MRPTTVSLIALLSLAGTVHAEVKVDFSGAVSADIRYRIDGERFNPPYPSQYKLLQNGFSRNENRIRAKLNLSVGEKVAAVADVELVHWGYSDLKDIDAGTLRERVDPYYLEAHAAYVDVYKVLPGLDLRIGRQIVNWGAADMFNPTSNINPLDVSDPLVFGRRLANNMVKADWNIKGPWTLSAVWVPIFRPSLLPRTAPLAVTTPNRPADVQEWRMLQTLGTIAETFPPSRIEVSGMQPDVTLDNSQAAVKLAGRVLGQDFSLSYYHGRTSFPVPAWSINRPGGWAEVGVIWPRMDVLGLDINGSIEKLGGLGYWIEAACIFPQQVTYGLYDDNITGAHTPITFDVSKGKKDDPAVYVFSDKGVRPTVIRPTPYPKITIGADYSIGERWYFNVQYLHGFVDEFGYGTVARLRGAKDVDPRIEQRIGDYIVAGVDLKVLSSTLTFRLFGIIKLPSLNPETWTFEDYRFTGVIFPQMTWAVWDSTEILLGGFIFLGDRSTKFGDPSTGASEVFAKAKFSF